MDAVLKYLPPWLSPERALQWAVALTIFLGSWFLGRMLGRLLSRVVRRRNNEQLAMIVRKFSFYAVVSVGTLIAFDHIGLELRVLLGAAGIASVALGFAAQTSVSNLISGLFLLAERAFVVGDVIRIGGTTGEVLTVDLLSVKLKTVDGLMVRIPNESVVKAEIVNLTHFPIRRIDVQVGISYHNSVADARAQLMAVAAENPRVLKDPEPLLIFLGFGASSQDLQFSVWVARDDFIQVKNELQEAIKAKFDAAGIEIPFPQQTLNVVGLPPLVLRQTENS